ncbi:MAG: EVE domain-containing protein [Nitrososphaerota archaeon]
MVSYWILVVKDHRLMDRIIPAGEVLKDRVKNKFWSLNSRTRNVNNIKPGDRVLFYVTGKDERGFKGCGIVATEPHPMTPEQRFHIIGMPSEAFDYSVNFSEAEAWDKPITLEEVAEKLSILKARRHLKTPFRGSIIRISEEDYQTILQFRKPK